MAPWRDWFGGPSSGERRKASRMSGPALVAYYWDGGAPVAHPIRDISQGGFYLDTKERWYPGTLLMVTLQRTDTAEKGQAASVSVQSRVVRTGEDGVAFAFVVPVSNAEANASGMQIYGADRKLLNSFLDATRRRSS